MQKTISVDDDLRIIFIMFHMFFSLGFLEYKTESFQRPFSTNSSFSICTWDVRTCIWWKRNYITDAEVIRTLLSIFIQIFVGIQVFILFPALLEQQNIGVFLYFAGKSMVSSRFSLPTNFIRLRSDFCNTFQKARLYLSCYFHFSKCSFNFSARPGPASTSSCLWSLTEATPREGDESAPHLLARN